MRFPKAARSPPPKPSRKEVVEIVADDQTDLLAQLDGREVKLPHRSVRLSTQGVAVRTLEMWWGERLLAVISNPTIAFLLLMFGFYGIIFEFYSPGWGVAGTLGVAFLVLGFFGLAVLPLNYAGLALIALALGLFAAEAFVVSFGALIVGGVVCLILGSIMLVDSPTGFMRVSLSVVVPIAVATGLITFFLVGNVVRTHRTRVKTGNEGLLGETAVADEDFSAAADVQIESHAFRGKVRVHGEYWNATCSEPVKAGQPLVVEDRDGLTLRVAPAKNEPSQTDKKEKATSTLA